MVDVKWLVSCLLISQCVSHTGPATIGLNVIFAGGVNSTVFEVDFEHVSLSFCSCLFLQIKKLLVLHSNLLR